MLDGAGNIPIVVDTGSGGAATARKLETDNTSAAGTGAAININSGAGAVPSVGGHIYLNGNVAQTAVNKVQPTLVLNCIIKQ